MIDRRDRGQQLADRHRQRVGHPDRCHVSRTRAHRDLPPCRYVRGRGYASTGGAHAAWIDVKMVGAGHSVAV